MSDGLQTSVCLDGGMELSRAVNEALRAVAGNQPTPAPASSVPWGGKWYCPADGARMHETHGQVICPLCSRHLPGPIVYQLIEFHDHQPVGTAYRDQ
jgi:hypothetical protein